MKYVALLLVVFGGVVACGPSFQALYECDVRFEHCYAVDQTAATPDAKRTCWREWLHGYTYGQSRDRVEYAAKRFGQLSLDVTPGLTVQPHTVAAPMPTNAFAPPPNVADGRSAPETAQSAPPDAGASEPPPSTVAARPAVRAPGAQCTEGCAQLWSTCHGHCKDQGCELCNGQYRTCVPACFGDQAGTSHGAPRSLR
ncbi:MAG: hypothetical protein M3O50_09145 [Myxococcota bacterium]|nr:hypothetical protein [Myxococcota bacterium]